MARIFIIEDDSIMAECLAHAALKAHRNNVLAEPKIKIFSNAIEALGALTDSLPDLILLDILPSGPDAFSLLNELISYDDTNKIPVILITSISLSTNDLSHYGIIKVLHKEIMTPEQISNSISEALQYAK